MPFKTFSEQLAEHLTFLRSNGLDVDTLEIGAGFVRCHAIDEDKRGRGEYAYMTQKNPMRTPGLVGLVSWLRAPGGTQIKHSTYGHDGVIEGHKLERPLVKMSDPAAVTAAGDIESKARYIWEQARETGRSDYLELKGVGAYGIRFLENAYGRVAAIPARDGGGTIRSLQFLNPDGAKRFLKGSVWSSLFHKLREPLNGQDIGLAESYVTAATCLELSGISVVCGFSSGNLPEVAMSLAEMYPASRLIVFADNDRHLKAQGLPNQGVLKARQARDAFKDRIALAIPDFGNLEASKEASDWNDLVRIKGNDCAKTQIRKLLNISTHQV